VGTSVIDRLSFPAVDLSVGPHTIGVLIHAFQQVTEPKTDRTPPWEAMPPGKQLRITSEQHPVRKEWQAT